MSLILKAKTVIKLVAVVVPMLILDLLLAACEPVENTRDCKSTDVFCVGMVTAFGGINDESINQSAWEGGKLAEKEIGAKLDYIESTSSKDYIKNITTFVDADYDVIITVGYAMGKVTYKAAAESPNIKFIGVDQSQDNSKPLLANLVGLTFSEDKASFLAGALAAQMTKTGKIGAVLATNDIQAFWRYGEGYKAGADYIDPAVEVKVTYHNKVSFEKSLSDPEWGVDVANLMITEGADVIFAAGGQTATGALIAAAQLDVYAIGADNDQYYTLLEARKTLLSSAIKHITPGVFELITMAKDENFPSGNYFGTTGCAPFHEMDNSVPAEVKIRLEAITSALADGKIQTNVVSPMP